MGAFSLIVVINLLNRLIMVDSGQNRSDMALVNRPLNKLSSKNAEINHSVFALMFREMVNYCDSRVATLDEQQAKLSEMGEHVGSRYLELSWFREKQFRRENRLIHLLTFVQKNLWKALFNKEIDTLEQAVDSENVVYYLIEKEPLVNRFVPNEDSGLNCAAFNAGNVQAFLTGAGFPCTVKVYWHKGTTLMVTMDQLVATTCPKTTCLPSSQEVLAVQRKNWDPLVLGPALAMERTPGPVCFSWKFSSLNLLP